jgi:site-specific DNA-cytosine methylase
MPDAQRARPHDACVVASYDINPVANDTYAHNFKRRPSGRDIRALTPAALDAHAADLWLLSPPCQARAATRAQRAPAALHACVRARRGARP